MIALPSVEHIRQMTRSPIKGDHSVNPPKGPKARNVIDSDHHPCVHIHHTIHHNLTTFCALKCAPRNPVYANTNGQQSQQNQKTTTKHHNSPQTPKITFFPQQIGPASTS